MQWDHRVWNMKEQNNGEDIFVVRETYYGEEGEVIGSADLTVMGDTPEELKWIAEQIIKSVERPVLVSKS